MEELGATETAEHWDRRHRQLGALRSGGDAGYDEASNEIFYAMRLGRLIDIVGDRTEQAAPLRILDAGCGKGYFAHAMARFGHAVDGIDLSEHAVELCRQNATGNSSFQVSPLAQWQPPYLYDVVYSIDVLFHIMDDALWEASVTNLATLVRLGGQLLVVDHQSEVDRTWSYYQRTRALHRYQSLLEPLGMQVDRFVPYGFRGAPTGFLVLERVA
ncbi:class I SAM-dependent methyltransferase [Kribbella sandramycini]|uniref:2-polyprenyl-3-methyl-5-hydroxy-6-metoxy-1, 4-benzoquinol methylase n=1 Tax=Kribbella sandramycini TaxID=60450 RepID=A0A7Y4L7Q9_9ACTN|nr:methyltransferase domain-containing protein [Kribbella sandramycini]MBB6570224.1 2-polyprenyl-3-methyl-5-hydroxy-6-metoxy-1,4-benzoquinol methylase [Kribbella sandramycini]NOL45923.1 class I SAM-dependent methyltransferase [Kribbella sandramycini]